MANGSTLNKGIPAKSPPPPTHGAQLGAPSRKPDLRVITSQGGKGLMHHLVSGGLHRGAGAGVGKSRAPAGGVQASRSVGLPKGDHGSWTSCELSLSRGPSERSERGRATREGRRKGQEVGDKVLCQGGAGGGLPAPRKDEAWIVTGS